MHVRRSIVNKKNLKLIAAIILPLIVFSCAKVYTREDFEKMPDRTFYLLPVESTFMVPASINTWKKIEENIGQAVVNGVKEMDVQRFRESIEKRYGIIVDITYFEKARLDEAESIKYYRALKDANATGSGSFTAVLSTGYRGYLDSGLYTQVEEIKKTRPCIIISHDTVIDEKNIRTGITISLYANDPDKGTARIGRSMTWSNTAGEENFDVRDVDYKAIYDGLSKITEYKYRIYGGTVFSSGDSMFLDGSM
ncbi:MAG TPA: hypothetical protein PK986_03585 [Spirochaetota bacterium]|nr:hypothetical protein [Spirochaetota bacterium]